MQGNTFVYGTATPAAQRAQCEQQVNKIIKANLPQELSKYFLFDAMQSSELLKKNVFAQIIKDNIENVMGFKKYLQLKRAAEKLQQEWAQQRLEAEKEAEEYNNYCKSKQDQEKELEENERKQDELYKFISAQQEEYERAKAGAENTANIQKKINELTDKLTSVAKKALDFSEDMNRFVDDIEISVFLPKLASNLSNEVEQILRLKEDLRKSNDGNCPIETLKEVTNKIVAYLKGLSLCSEEVDEESIVQHVIALQNSNRATDPYDFLEESEVAALRNLIQTSGANRFVTLDRIRMELDAGKIVVVAGFQGINDAGDVTTLGRGGSDTTAVALAAELKADRCQIFTDVDGVYDRDPRVYADAIRFGRISYERMLALIENGAQVLHDRSVLCARDAGIPIEVLSAFTGAPGTIVG